MLALIITSFSQAEVDISGAPQKEAEFELSRKGAKKKKKVIRGDTTESLRGTFRSRDGGKCHTQPTGEDIM